VSFTASFETLSTEESLRDFTRRTLHHWINEIDGGRIPIKIPRLRGTMRLLPDKVFHLHPELFLQLSGVTLFHFPEETLRVGPGEICVVPRGMPHSERVRAWRGPFANLVFMYAREAFFHLALEKPRGRPSGTIGSPVGKIGRGGIALLDEAAELAHSGGSARALGLKGLMLAHLSLLLTALEGGSPPALKEPFKVTQARQWVIQLLADPGLSVSRLSRELQCSPDYLSHLFRKTTGSTLQSYINGQRLIRARELLETSALNIAQVSQAAGFRDPSYFSRAYRRWSGVTPREVRREVNEGTV
jgi:AraC-like DNA-binding protein